MESRFRKKTIIFLRFVYFFALWPGWNIFFLPESSIPTTVPCFFIFVALPSHPWPSNLTQTAFISLFHPPSLNFLPHFFWVLLMFFQNSLFPLQNFSSPQFFKTTALYYYYYYYYFHPRHGTYFIFMGLAYVFSKPPLCPL